MLPVAAVLDLSEGLGAIDEAALYSVIRVASGAGQEVGFLVLFSHVEGLHWLVVGT